MITPSSVESAYCENKVEYARELQKRIVPMLRTRYGPRPCLFCWRPSNVLLLRNSAFRRFGAQ